MEGGGQINATYYQKSPAGALGGDGAAASRERYHQSKLANIAFAMAFHAKAARAPAYANFRALSAAPGWSETNLKIPRVIDHQWLKDLIALSAPDGSCSLLRAMYDPSAQSGDFYEPESLMTGPPIKVIAEGVPFSPHFPRRLCGIRDAEVCSNDTFAEVWKASELGLGEEFVIGERPIVTLQV